MKTEATTTDPTDKKIPTHRTTINRLRKELREAKAETLSRRNLIVELRAGHLAEQELLQSQLSACRRECGNLNNSTDKMEGRMQHAESEMSVFRECMDQLRHDIVEACEILYPGFDVTEEPIKIIEQRTGQVLGTRVGGPFDDMGEQPVQRLLRKIYRGTDQGSYYNQANGVREYRRGF